MREEFKQGEIARYKASKEACCILKVSQDHNRDFKGWYKVSCGFGREFDVWQWELEKVEENENES